MTSIIDRLSDKLLLTSSGCWEFIGGRDRAGYGVIHYQKRQWRVHRLSWEIENGPIPHNMRICHHCDNKPCANLEHLFLGTDYDNIHDMIDKGRDGFKGDRNGRTRLTSNEVIEIRRLLESNTQQRIAELYNVSRPTIAAIKSGRNWGAL